MLAAMLLLAACGQQLGPNEMKLSGTIENLDQWVRLSEQSIAEAPIDSIYLDWEFDSEPVQLAATELSVNDGKASFTLQLELPGEGVYTLRTGAFKKDVWLDAGSHAITISLPSEGTIVTSTAESIPLHEKFEFFATTSDRLVGQAMNGDTTAREKFFVLYDSMRSADDRLATMLKLRDFPEYVNVQEEFATPADYYDQFWNDFDLTDSTLGTFDGLRARAHVWVRESIITSAYPSDALSEKVKALAQTIVPGSATEASFLNGAMQGSAGRNDELFDWLAKRYLAHHPDGRLVADVEQELALISKLAVGAPAPEISLPTPEGSPLSLSDLKGKTVLIDFWASWCRPCLEDIPHLKALYAKAKDKGFTILSISIDTRDAAWRNALRKYEMPWPQVVASNGYEAEAARTYFVNAIPYNLVVGPDGTIIGKSMRGDVLDNFIFETLGIE